MGEEAPKVSKETMSIIYGPGAGQILLPFNVGDASITFSSRWALALMIENAILAARIKGAN
jgi:hypothetical protein